MKKNYGVLGLGVVGRSVLSFLYTNAEAYQVKSLSVMDKRAPNEEEADFLAEHHISYIPESDAYHFFSSNDVIIPSPGIDRTPFLQHQHKFLEELDLFFDEWRKPIISVTGTVGKTSIVHLLDKILNNNGLRVATGGNIGTGMLDLLSEKDKADYALLELSSFQLEHCKKIAPDLAIITNLYPNHLDRHGTMTEYLKAKTRCIMHQAVDQKALVPWALKKDIKHFIDRPLSYFSVQPISDFSNLQKHETLYTLENNKIYALKNSEKREVFAQEIPNISYLENWLIIGAACDMLGLLEKQKSLSMPLLDLPTHRFEKVATINDVTFFNDSKSTIVESTLSAIEHLHPQKIHLFLGGVSKGVKRTELLEQFKDKVASITCFGSEAEELYKACTKIQIPSSKHATLEEAFTECVKHANRNDIVLFSPAGASYDLYKNYKERGEEFVKLVKALK